MKLSSIALTFGLAAISSISCAQSATYMIEPTHTYVTWEAKHFGTSTSRGRFDKKADSINTGFSVFDKHLQSEEFFASEKFPQARFVGNAFKFDGDKVTEVAGTLTLRGKTNPVVLKATGFNCYSHPMLKREVCGGDFETTIVRSQYDVSYGLPGIPDNIRLLIQVEAVKQ